MKDIGFKLQNGLSVNEAARNFAEGVKSMTI